MRGFWLGFSAVVGVVAVAACITVAVLVIVVVPIDVVVDRGRGRDGSGGGNCPEGGSKEGAFAGGAFSIWVSIWPISLNLFVYRSFR